MKIVRTQYNTPDMCLHSSRFNSLTQFISLDDNNKQKVKHFFTSRTHYWILADKELPTTNNSRGKVPHGFRGDAAFFRQLKRCEDNKTIVPMIIVVDNVGTIDGQTLNYLIYDIKNDSWSQRLNLKTKNDSTLGLIRFYEGFSTIDSIINFANIKVGPFADKLGDENIFIFSTAQNGTKFFDWVRLSNGCIHMNGTTEGKAIEFFNGYLDRALWRMNQSMDTAMVYITYPKSKSNDLPKEADISLFEGNTHYQFTVHLSLVSNGFLHCNRKWLLGQYYSTWLGCAEGATPEPPIVPHFVRTRGTVKGQTIGTDEGNDYDGTDYPIDEQNQTKWRDPFDHEEPVHDFNHDDDGTLTISVISGLMVFSVAFVLLALLFLIFYIKKDSKDKSDKSVKN